MQHITVTQNDFSITTDKSKLDLAFVHEYLANQSYWAKGIPFEKVKSSAENSLTFAVLYQDHQVGYARVITDYTTIAYLGDVFIDEEFRGQGLSKWLMETIMSHPNLQGLRRWILLTLDAHKLYEQYGFNAVEKPERYMEKFNPNVYL
ncbi:GNAT family N-acetyltransferase [Solitalea canadensis]|uniref:Acetyltransferase n=1 Tax=Solitalea canadensis (strain ATCC 29591 / DSM 3403 / JCM 21819 / LMG 8368 / NBRC 15130 / NCIMB 12057 / USAM 9D) TaxID=929556 RepID=H8KKZ9_SOLCM|nr:GNAT family N-acetyltransferase [Solitalea canadensis]AFD08816.1 acetyltransferase [Solitalea canadensis DSM 3403]